MPVDSIDVTVFIEVLAFGVSALIISAILVIETASWYLENKASNDTETQLEIQMTIEGVEVNSPPSATKSLSVHSNAPTTSSHDVSSDAKSKSVSVSSDPIATETKSKSSNPVMYGATIITYISYICYSTTAITAKLGIGIHDRCDKSVALPSFFYMISKSCLYLVLLYRIYFVYRNSVFQKNTAMLKVAAAFIIFWGLFVSISNVILLDVQTIHTEDGSVYCQQTSNGLLVLIFIFFDFIINIGCCYSFTRPLLWLSVMNSKKQKSSCSESKKLSLYNIVVKYVILTAVAVSSTFLFLMPLILMGIQWSPAVDVVINSFCIMLFNKSYDRYYKCLCCGAHAIGHNIIQMQCCYGTKTDSKDVPS